MGAAQNQRVNARVLQLLQILRNDQLCDRVAVVEIAVLDQRHGEDGTIQGLFELARIPYVGCGVLGSAVCMDKAVANALMDAAGVPHCKWVAASRADLELNGPVVLDGIEAKLGYPIFVKPANAGSSVGISKVADRAALEKGVEIALREDCLLYTSPSPRDTR